MKQFYRLAWLTLVIGLLAACSSPPPNGSGDVDEASEAASVEVEQSVPEPTEPPAEVETEVPVAEEEEEEEEEAEDEGEPVADDTEMAEADMAEEVAVVDGPTHVPATNVQEALVEKPYDQVKGAEEPILTVIEYGDFQ
ncbi:MAG: hypothetical protein AB8G95_03760 [Anaerolineae bacterium]